MTKGQRIIKGLEGFLQKLKDGVPIEATKVTRVETPDGPMHIREHVVIMNKNDDGQG